MKPIGFVNDAGVVYQDVHRAEPVLRAAVARTGGGGSSLVRPAYAVTPLDGIKEAAGAGVDVGYALGAAMEGEDVEVDGRVVTLARGMGRLMITSQGIGLAAPDPLYVLEIRARERTIVVGPNEALYRRSLLADQLNWIGLPGLDRPLLSRARIRYKHKEAAATLVPLPGEKVSVEFERAQRAIAPGQSVVFYDGDLVLGGGIIEAALE